jgi:transketolase
MQKNLLSYLVKLKLAMDLQINLVNHPLMAVPLGLDEIKLVRNVLNWNYKPFEIPNKILNEWKKIGKKGQKLENDWNKIYKKKKILINKLLKNDFTKILKREKQKAIDEIKSLATRKSSELTLNALTSVNNNLIGGSADLAGSNNTKTKHHKIIKPGEFDGNYIHYGVREHAMSGIMNGLALHSNFIPYGGTFLIFSDYCKPSIRLSALMQQRVIYVMTHDSIGSWRRWSNSSTYRTIVRIKIYSKPKCF